MKLCHLTSVHSWNDTRIFHKMCRSLADAGHEVHLIAARGPTPPAKTGKKIQIHLLKQPANRLVRMWRTTREILMCARELGADLFHFHDPEFLPWAGQFQTRVAAPVIYDVHEDYRVHMVKPWLPRSLQWVASHGVAYCEDNTARKLAGIVAATPHIAARFTGHARTIVVQNFPRIEEFAAAETREEGLFVYVGGTFTQARGILEMIRALPIAGPMVRLALAGRWASEQLRAKCVELEGWKQVVECGFLDRTAMTELLSRAQAGLVLFHPLDNHVCAQPNKLYEYMAAGLPVIASNFQLWRDIVGDGLCGLLVDPLDPAAIGNAMRWVLKHPSEAAAMGRNGRKAVENTFSWQNEYEKLSLFYNQVLAERC